MGFRLVGKGFLGGRVCGLLLNGIGKGKADVRNDHYYNLLLWRKGMVEVRDRVGLTTLRSEVDVIVNGITSKTSTISDERFLSILREKDEVAGSRSLLLFFRSEMEVVAPQG